MAERDLTSTKSKRILPHEREGLEREEREQAALEQAEKHRKYSELLKVNADFLNQEDLDNLTRAEFTIQRMSIRRALGEFGEQDFVQRFNGFLRNLSLGQREGDLESYNHLVTPVGLEKRPDSRGKVVEFKIRRCDQIKREVLSGKIFEKI